MSLEDLGNLGEFIAAVAVVVTLVYLAIQIRQNTRQIGDNTRALRLSSRDATQQAFSRWRHLVSAAETADLHIRGCADFASLSAAERFRFGVLLQELFLSYEAMHRLIPEELYERELWEKRQLPFLAKMLCQPGVHMWWEQNKLMFLPDFADAIDRTTADVGP
jgi:hypothetical protein